jgi:nucleoside-diphosphate-sugar epimerase
MNWKGKKVLVTDACSFIGSHIVEYLVQKGDNMRAFINYKIDINKI